MPLKNYGLLTGSLVDHGPQDGGNPHHLLIVRAGITNYRVAVNLHATRPQGDKPSGLRYQVLDDLKGSSLVANIQNHNRFVLCDQDPSIPRLDYIRDGILDMKKFESISRRQARQNSPFYRAFVRAAEMSRDNGGFVAVFGTGYPDQDDRPQGPGNNPLRSSSGFSGIDNVHMNQGNFLRVDNHHDHNYQNNGIHQDGAVIFFIGEAAIVGFFTKFDSQDSATDNFGNPLHTGVAMLDSPTEILPNVRKKLLARGRPLDTLARDLSPVAANGPRTQTAPSPEEIPITGTSGGDLTNGFVFGSPDAPDDPNHVFEDDDDSQYRRSPFVKNFAANGVPEPVPGPRDGKYPTMALEDVLGTAAVNSISRSGQIVFHLAGDTGAPAQSKLPQEVSVADLMLQDFASGMTEISTPKFFYHVGDVVYFYGEEEYYYGQFYKPYQLYPAPIFAIPGNHDGITYTPDMVSLDGFVKAFCDDKPRHWAAAGGIGRSTMTQPGVYFTLDSPLVSIIGLYTNCSESYGYLDDQQKLFLYKELMRLKEPRQNGEIAAVLLAVHHSPLSFSIRKPGSQALKTAIENACAQAGYWPDAVFSGHAHVYQRMTRTVRIGSDDWDIPHVIAGSGGYAAVAGQEVDKSDMSLLDTSDRNFRLHQFYAHFGYLRVTIKEGDRSNPPTLKTEFLSPDINNGQPVDPCTLDLRQHRLM